MKFIDFLNVGFSDREDYNDFLSFYKKIIKSYNNEEAVLSIPGVFSRKLKFVISDHGAARWMQRGHSENSNSTELKDFLKSNPGYTGVFLETAHPTKFKDVVEEAIDNKIELPQKLREFMKGKKQSISITSDFITFKKLLPTLLS